ncbi:F-box/LRR protein, partial [Trifolium pratense]
SSYVGVVEALSLALIKLRKSLIITDELLYSIAREVLPLMRLDLQLCTNYSYNGILCLLSNCQGIKYLDLQGAYFLEDEHVVELSSLLRDLEFINLSWCAKLTKSALFTLTKNCPSLSEIKMESIGSKSVHNSDSFVEFGVRPQLKSLYLGLNSWLSNESIIMFASVFPNLQLLDLWSFKPLNDISEGICEVLRKCSKIRHLKLNGCSRVNLLGLNFVVPNLEVLNLSDFLVEVVDGTFKDISLPAIRMESRTATVYSEIVRSAVPLLLLLWLGFVVFLCSCGSV